ncbi:hypothetical protein WBO78_03780 [Bosea sp. CCNWLW174]|uniref:hypothetical protein n=1 Tax=unclassified Bosea (in: a-proteobacteria) TaxID=2653178 RepID=UPI0030145A96
MKVRSGIPLGIVFAGLCVAASSAVAAPGFGAVPLSGGFSAPAPRLSPMRPVAKSSYSRRGRVGVYGAGYPGFYGGSGDQRVVVVLPEASEPPPDKERSIPVAIGIARPPAADPLLYRIETRQGQPVVRVMRFSSDGRVARR